MVCFIEVYGGTDLIQLVCVRVCAVVCMRMYIFLTEINLRECFAVALVSQSSSEKVFKKIEMFHKGKLLNNSAMFKKNKL